MTTAATNSGNMSRFSRIAQAIHGFPFRLRRALTSSSPTRPAIHLYHRGLFVRKFRYIRKSSRSPTTAITTATIITTAAAATTTTTTDSIAVIVPTTTEADGEAAEHHIAGTHTVITAGDVHGDPLPSAADCSVCAAHPPAIARNNMNTHTRGSAHHCWRQTGPGLPSCSNVHVQR